MKKRTFLFLLFPFVLNAQNEVCIDSSIKVEKQVYIEYTDYDTSKIIERQLLPVSESCIRKNVWWPRKRCWTETVHDSIVPYTYFVPETITYDSPFTYCYTPAPVYGAMIFGSPDELSGKDSVLKRLGVNTVRETILLDGWPNNKARLNYWLKTGYDVILNINYTKQQTQSSIFLPYADTAIYRQKVKEILTEFPNIKVVVVENEEVNKSYRNWSLTTLGNYLKSLRIANEVCHEMGVKCTNGGLMLDELKSLTRGWLDAEMPLGLMSGSEFLSKLFLGVVYTYETKGLNPNYEDKKAKTDWLIDQYNAIGIDYINIHLYFPLAYRGSGIDAAGITTAVGFKEIVAYLRSRTHIPIISNEIGSVNEDTGMIINMIEAYNYEGLDYMIYYSGKDLNNLLAKPLHNGDGSINSQGIIFKNTIKP